MVEEKEQKEYKEHKEPRENKKVEMKAGLEIHQQLDTGKLFCRCPSVLRTDEPDWIAKRKLHAVAGEKGKVDLAAKHETEKEKEFIYQGYKDTNCLIEFDEQPPLEIDKEALKIACQVALLLNCEVLPITQIMRKTVIDGSNTSGFQRTLLLARNGFIETSFGRVGIATICLEEDAARIIEHTKEKTIYRLDRLGIPLIEIATSPEIYYPSQVKEAALKIGEILRACKVKRGIGTIRQDVNISVPKGERIEIKGFQDPSIMIKTVELEIQRQKNLIQINEILGKNKVKEIKENIFELNKIFENTQCNLIKNVLLKNGKVFGTRLKGFAGILGKELYEGKRFGTELSDYAKVYGVGGIIHSDENLSKYTLLEGEINSIKQALDIQEGDAFVLVASDYSDKGMKALSNVIKRANMQIKNAVIKEVRKSNPDASTSFLRPMPGADRMYPETDLPLLKIGREFLNEIRNSLPKLKSDIKGELKQKGLDEEMLKLVLESGKLSEFESLLNIYNNPNFAAKILLLIPKEIASHEKINFEKAEEIFNLDVIERVLKEISFGRIKEEDAKYVLEKIAKGMNIEQALKVEKIELSHIESEIAKLIKEKPGLSVGAYMGLVMEKFRGKISGKEVMQILGKLVK